MTVGGMFVGLLNLMISDTGLMLSHDSNFTGPYRSAADVGKEKNGCWARLVVVTTCELDLHFFFWRENVSWSMKIFFVPEK